MFNNMFDNFVGDIVMCGVFLLKQNICFGKMFGWQVVLWLLQNCGCCRNFWVGIQGVSDIVVYIFWVQIRYNFVGLFMYVFVLDDSMNGY